MAKLLFEDGRVQIETQGGCAIWMDEGEALMVAHLLVERLSVPSPADSRILYERGFGPGDGDGHVIPACLECGQPAGKDELWCDAHGYSSSGPV